MIIKHKNKYTHVYLFIYYFTSAMFHTVIKITLEFLAETGTVFISLWEAC